VTDVAGVIEFRHTDGSVGKGDFTPFKNWPPRRGDHLTHEGADWQMYDREDRGGVPVYLFKPAE
jgi:hypothetical protein